MYMKDHFEEFFGKKYMSKGLEVIEDLKKLYKVKNNYNLRNEAGIYYSKRKYLSFALIFSILFLFCQPPDYPSPCSQKSKIFQSSILFKAARNDKLDFCGLNLNSESITGASPGIQTVATPVFSPISGNYNTFQNLTITSATSGASIYFTVDGSTPTTNSNLYTGAATNLWVIAGLTLKAFATKSGMRDSAVATADYSYLPLKTGQTVCYDATTSVTCPGIQDDGASQRGSARGYINNGDGTVTDNATGLVWQRCPLGLSGATCSIGSQTASNYATGISTCSGLTLAGKTWRLPTYFELQTLSNFSLIASDPTFFPNASSFYWSSTTATVLGNNLNAYTINSSIGRTDNATAKTTATPFVRCVSGLQKNITPNFTDNGDFTIKDNITGLTWQKCSRGLNNDSTCSGTATASDFVTGISYCNSLGLAGKTWRLPNVNELFSIVDVSVGTQPPINTTFFPGTPAGANYWTSTTLQGTPTSAWLVSFNSGIIIDSGKVGANLIRCVSGP